MVSDATGSGKTRMGAWLIRGAFDRQLRMGQSRPATMIVTPPQVVEQWEKQLQETAHPFQVHSHGPLSNSSASRHALLTTAISDIEILAVDEAHNFLNWSDRTRRIVSHYADNALLFTATPINKGASDLLALVELLGADNLPQSCLDVLGQLRRGTRDASKRNPEHLERLQEEIRRFSVRRTRAELNAIAESRSSEYRLPTGRSACYPRHEPLYYPCDCRDSDSELAREIANLAERLKGISRVGNRLELPRGWDSTEEAYVRRVVASARALARYHVMKSLRSSSAALFEHVHGTSAAFEKFAAHLTDSRGKTDTGNMVLRCEELAGQVPEWRLKRLKAKSVEPSWLWDPGAHRRACQEEAELYRQIGQLVVRMQRDREEAKIDRLVRLYAEHGQVLAFDSHVITLKLFQNALESRKVSATLLTGAGGKAAKRRATQSFGLGAGSQPLVALCSDAFSEGLNLQKASCVVHLDAPTVIRTAEQRAGRVDRMDSPHKTVQIWWPKDPEAFMSLPRLRGQRGYAA
ncbi:helicase-related protein [Myxococcus faecalis]|uniref:helicase-related protein n=1 Tax=Myxococcus faecalis TaxID=3115646 RepID=UPI003CEBD332